MWLQCQKQSTDAAFHLTTAEAYIKYLEAQLATAEARADKLEQQLADIERTAATLKEILGISTGENVLGAHVFLAHPVSVPESKEHPTEPLPRAIRGHTHAQVDLTQPPIDIFPQM